MEDNGGTMTFFAFPREIRDLIYSWLAPNEKTYSITSANNVTTIEAFGAFEPNLGIIRACKTTQYEMLETICRDNTFGFSVPGFDTDVQSLYHELSTLMAQVDFYIDLGPLDRYQAMSRGRVGTGIRSIRNQLREACRIFNSRALKRKSCRIIIRNMDFPVSTMIRLQIFDDIKTLVGVETLMIIVMEEMPDMGELVSFLEPALGLGTYHYEWPPIPWAKWDYFCIQFHPRKNRAGQIG